jgi:hypothetical protein
LNEWLCQLQRLEHKPPVDFDLSIGSGSQDLLTKVNRKKSCLEKILTDISVGT